MENLPIELPAQLTETIEAAPALPPVEPQSNNLRDAGIVVGVIVLAVVCAKFYKCTAKKK
jgi:hypothetical protein